MDATTTTALGLMPDCLHTISMNFSEVGRETRFGDRIIPEGHGGLGGDDAVVAVRDVGEREPVDEYGLSLEGLDQVWHEGVPEYDHHGSDASELSCGHRLLVVGVGDDDALEPLPEIGIVGGKCQDGGYLGSGGDEEPALVGHSAVEFGVSETHDDVPELAGVHVHGLLPHYAGGVDVQGVVPDEVVLQDRGQEVVGGRYRMDVSGEFEIDLPHGIHLGHASPGSPSLHSEGGSHGGLPEGSHDFLPDLRQSLDEADGGYGRPFLVQDVQGDLGDVLAVLLEVFGRKSDLGSDLCDVANLCALGDLDIGLHDDS